MKKYVLIILVFLLFIPACVILKFDYDRESIDPANADLKEISVSSGTLSPEFDKNTTIYLLRLQEPDVVVITPGAVNNLAKITFGIKYDNVIYSQVTVLSNRAAPPVNITDSSHDIVFMIQSPDESEKNEYIISIRIDPLVSSTTTTTIPPTTTTTISPTTTTTISPTTTTTISPTTTTTISPTTTTTISPTTTTTLSNEETEPNGSSVTADGPLVSNTTYHGEISVGGDEDWFMFEIDYPGPILITLTHLAGYDLDWDLYLSPDMATTVATGRSTTSPDAVQKYCQSGDYYIKVYGFNGDNGSYDLTIQYQETDPIGITVHFKKPADYTNPPPYIHFWDTVDGETTWPGYPMLSEENNWYYFTFSTATSANVVFNNNTSPQTLDLFRSGSDGWYYFGSWYSSKPD